MPLRNWQDWLMTVNGVACLAVLAAPLAAAAAVLLAQHRRRNGAAHGWAWRSAVTEIGMLYGTVPLIWLTMLPGSEAGSAIRRVSLVPLRDLATMDEVGVVGNLLIFAAVGFLAPLRFVVLASVPRMLAVGAAGSTLVETLQYVLRLDRVSSVDDVLLNTMGAALAAPASAPWWITRADTPHRLRHASDRPTTRTMGSIGS
jgi:glycopeptide antibiotics resistance protein